MSSVSVIIPCYRYAQFLPECVASVLAQRDVDLRVLILDDASPDETPAVAAALAAADSRIEYRRHAANQGHIATYNDGLAWASGDYTAMVSADDLLTPGALARAARLLDAHPEVGFVYGSIVPFVSGQPLPPARPAGGPQGDLPWQISPGLEWFKTACRRAHVYIVSPEVVMRTDLQHQLGGYRAELPHSADVHLWLRFALHADVGRLIDSDQSYYRSHAGNLHNVLAPTRYIDLTQRQAAFEAALQEYAERHANSAALHRTASRGFARQALGAAGAVLGEGAGGAEQAAELTGYAFHLYPGAAATPEYFGLQLVRLFGPGLLPLLRAGHRRLFYSWPYHIK
jgi:Glycosyl transferase family 2